MSDEQLLIAMAYPADPVKREALRKIVQMPMAVYANSVVMPCARCGEPLTVGPRVAEKVHTKICAVYCPTCAARVAAERSDGSPLRVFDLGNTPIRHELP